MFIFVWIVILYFRKTIHTTHTTHTTNSEQFVSNRGKIAFLFLTRDNVNIPEIWEKYLKGKEGMYSLYCHPKYPKKVNGLLKSHIIPENFPTSWGDIGTVRANLMMLKNALKDQDNKYFILCSESCVPITSFDRFYEFIFQKNKSFIPYFVENLERWDRIKNPVIKKDEFKKHCAQGLVFYRKHAEILTEIDETDNWRDVICVDESYFYNILYWRNPNIEKELENYKITFDAWDEQPTSEFGAMDRGLIKPVSDDIRKKDGYINYEYITDEFVQIVVDSGYFFMRKVHPTLLGKNIILERV